MTVSSLVTVPFAFVSRDGEAHDARPVTSRYTSTGSHAALSRSLLAGREAVSGGGSGDRKIGGCRTWGRAGAAGVRAHKQRVIGSPQSWPITPHSVATLKAARVLALFTSITPAALSLLHTFKPRTARPPAFVSILSSRSPPSYLSS